MSFKSLFEKIDSLIVSWMRSYGFFLLRISLGIIFIWFGILKPLGLSPAAELAANTIYWFSPEFFVPFLGLWEVAIGVCLLFRPLIRIGLFLLFTQMVGTFLPLIILPHIVFVDFPFVLSMEGQYIIKNLVLISAGIVVGGSLKN
ncbi:hypothetical protein CMO90_01100 [Candidatus Woesearchaeota archaeon]|nr:hypothetical protein [Candidatus Woesearchaeota archaeon]|tara:strand:+ start:1246 stop:1680 length:435 start_codon:yes stop_codon:yes gene_type:complete